MKRIALKIDVDTCRGTLFGVPALIELLQKHNASGSFFFSFGPDSSGREARSTSLKRYYDRTTRLYGRLLPSPNIGRQCAELMRQTNALGFETGLHAWDRVAWEKTVLQAENDWIESEMSKACGAYLEIFAEKAAAHAAAGWRMNRHALRLTQRLGFTYASDCRGSHPFIPVIDGEIVACPQIPTTLPTVDEIFALEPGIAPEQAIERILQQSEATDGKHQVFTLRAELEGIKFIAAFERLVASWKDRGYQLVSLADVHASLEKEALPLHAVNFAEIPGRPGLRMTQGPAFLAD